MVENGEMPLDRKTQVSAAEMETIRLWIERLAASENLSRPARSIEPTRHYPDHAAPLHDLP